MTVEDRLREASGELHELTHRSPIPSLSESRGLPPRRPVSAVAIAGIAALVVVFAIGAIALLLRSDAAPPIDEPAPSTTLSEGLSVDALNWSRISLGTEGPGLQITAGGPGLVGFGVYHEPDPSDLADGSGGPGWVQGYRDLPAVWFSRDGYDWARVPGSERAFGGVEIADVAGGNNGFVAVAGPHRAPRAWTSPDGFTWTAVPAGSFHSTDLRGVTSGGPGFVAWGEGESNHATIWTSPDGYGWARAPDDSGGFDAEINAITDGGPGLVAVGSGHETCEPVVWTSTDGRRWVRHSYDPAVFGETPQCGLFGGFSRINDVTTGGPGLVAVGSDDFLERAAVWTSRDGVTWARAPHDVAAFGATFDEERTWMTGVAAVGDGLVAIGRKGESPAVWISHDGLAWTDITDDFDLTGGAGMIEVIAGGPGAIILGEVLIADSIHGQPLIETVIWIGSPNDPAG